MGVKSCFFFKTLFVHYYLQIEVQVLDLYRIQAGMARRSLAITRKYYWSCPAAKTLRVLGDDQLLNKLGDCSQWLTWDHNRDLKLLVIRMIFKNNTLVLAQPKDEKGRKKKTDHTPIPPFDPTFPSLYEYDTNTNKKIQPPEQKDKNKERPVI